MYVHSLKNIITAIDIDANTSIHGSKYEF